MTYKPTNLVCRKLRALTAKAKQIGLYYAYSAKQNVNCQEVRTSVSMTIDYRYHSRYGNPRCADLILSFCGSILVILIKQNLRFARAIASFCESYLIGSRLLFNRRAITI